MTLVTTRRKRRTFYLWIAVFMTCTVLVGFGFTYFGPLFRRSYPAVSPLVHVHGWTFFAWYVLLPVQARLIHTRQVKIHRAVGLASMSLAAAMIGVGLIVSTVRIDTALGLDGDPFWDLMGLPIFSIWILFTVFYGAAIRYRRQANHHKRLMLLASAAALSAATFRIVVRIFGFEPWVAIVGTLSTVLFIFAGMIYDFLTLNRIHPVYLWGAPATIALIGGAFLLALTPTGDLAKEGLAWVGRLLAPLY